MKIGITINDYYKQYLSKIANLNSETITAVCGLIVENFLNYNMKQKRFPVFVKSVSIVFNEENIKSDSNSVNCSNNSSGMGSSSKHLSMKELLAEIEECHNKDNINVDLYDDELPF